MHPTRQAYIAARAMIRNTPADQHPNLVASAHKVLALPVCNANLRGLHQAIIHLLVKH